MARPRQRRLGVAAGLVGMLLTVNAPTGAAARAGTYVVRPHDTLSGIAAAVGTTVPALEAINHLSGDRIFVGEALVLPDAAASASDPRPDPWSDAHGGPRHDGDPRHGGHDAGPPAVPSSTASPMATAVAPAASPTATAGATTASPTAAPVTAGTQPMLTATSSLSVEAILTSEAQAAGVDPALVKAIAWQESGWRMVTAADGGIGIMQLMPATVVWLSRDLLGAPVDPYDPTSNIHAGVALLRYDLQALGNERLAVAAYNQGLQSVRTQGIGATTARYVANVLALRHRFAQ